jgi:hypothetical protein
MQMRRKKKRSVQSRNEPPMSPRDLTSLSDILTVVSKMMSVFNHQSINGGLS